MLRQTFNFQVEMPCNGSAKDVRQILQEQLEEGTVMSYTVDPIEKLVRVTTHLSLHDIQAALQKTGNHCTFLSSVNANIFNPGSYRFPKPPSNPSRKSKGKSKSQSQGRLNLKRPSTQPQPTTKSTYDAPQEQMLSAPTPQPPSVPVPTANSKNTALPHTHASGGQSQGQKGQRSSQPIIRASRNNKQRINELAPTSLSNPPTPTHAAAHGVAHQSILSGAPVPVHPPTFKSFPTSQNVSSNANAMANASTTGAGNGNQLAGLKTKSGASSLSRRKRSSRKSINKNRSASVGVLRAATEALAESAKEVVEVVMQQGPEAEPKAQEESPAPAII